MPKHRNLASVLGAADYLNISERHVRSLIYRRQLPHFKVGGRIRFDLDDLDAWLDAHRVEAA